MYNKLYNIYNLHTYIHTYIYNCIIIIQKYCVTKIYNILYYIITYKKKRKINKYNRLKLNIFFLPILNNSNEIN